MYARCIMSVGESVEWIDSQPVSQQHQLRMRDEIGCIFVSILASSLWFGAGAVGCSIVEKTTRFSVIRRASVKQLLNRREGKLFVAF